MITLRVVLREGYRLITRLLGALPENWLRSFLMDVAKHRARTLIPEEGLRFLLELDSRLYALEGALAVDYGGGVHTKHRHMKYHDFFMNRIKAQERVLDIGCGIGAVAYDIAKNKGARILAMDINPENIYKARACYSHELIEYRLGDITKGICEGPFDVVILSNVLEHLPHREAFLMRIQIVAKPNRILIRVPVYERDWRVPLRRELGVEWRLDSTHEIEYTLESFSDEMKAAGLVVTSQEVRWGEIWAETVSRARKE